VECDVARLSYKSAMSRALLNTAVRMEVGGWRVEGGGWRVEGGGWRVEGGG
jgi:hypothetical protein